MSQETSQWLNQNVLVGQTDRRGHAWHYKESDQGTEPNHYPGFIPVPDVRRRLFGFTAQEAPVATLREVTVDQAATLGGAVIVGDDGKTYRVVIDQTHKAIVPDDGDEVLGIHGPDYRIHPYDEWLLKNVGTLLDDDLGITSAGLLRHRAQAWVEVSVPDNVETKHGVTYRPNILAYTSLDGSLATSYSRTITAVVCDNTLAAAIRGEGEHTWKVKHTSNSLLRVADARAALDIIWKSSDEFQKSLDALIAQEVTQQQWEDLLNLLVPLPAEANKAKATKVLNKREAIDALYLWDTRVAPWKGTAYGAYAAFNTYEQHQATFRNTTGGGRVERNQLATINGRLAKADTKVLEAIGQVVGAAA
jgi:phage/plasmid-like protein (TIGR03299 family)